MKIGYACLAIGVPGSEMKTCRLKSATAARLLALIEHNLYALEKLIDYNIQNGIRLFRISSDLIPFGSSLARTIPWGQIQEETLERIGRKILDAGMRVSMHPGQYTVLNSPNPEVRKRAVQDLEYHTNVLDALHVGPDHKIILHVGGAYGDKPQAQLRFITEFNALIPAIRKRVVLENDNVSFTIREVLDVAAAVNIPVVYDNLHNEVNPADVAGTDRDWISRCAQTWNKRDGKQKTHYSQQADDKRPGAHSESIRIDPFLTYCDQLAGMDVDIMLEVKDKNLSALKCINCTADRRMRDLEIEWARYKYSILERSPEHYLAIRKLLRDKDAYPAVEMYRMVETAIGRSIVTGNAVNAAQHVWGYFKDKATASEKKRFANTLDRYATGESSLQSVKNNLFRLAQAYQVTYLLEGYYFHL